MTKVVVALKEQQGEAKPAVSTMSALTPALILHGQSGNSYVAIAVPHGFRPTDRSYLLLVEGETPSWLMPAHLEEFTFIRYLKTNESVAIFGKDKV